MTKENLKIFNSLDEKITGTDIILLLLNVGRIKGKIEFQKQVFLAWKELFFKHSTDLGYIPHRYGAYSKSVEVSSRYLESGRSDKDNPDEMEKVQLITLQNMVKMRSTIE